MCRSGTKWLWFSRRHQWATQIWYKSPYVCKTLILPRQQFVLGRRKPQLPYCVKLGVCMIKVKSYCAEPPSIAIFISLPTLGMPMARTRTYMVDASFRLHASNQNMLHLILQHDVMKSGQTHCQSSIIKATAFYI